MINLPSGVDVNNLINDLRNLSWEACDTLLYYSKKLKDPNTKNNILKNENNDNPVTLADLRVNEIIIQKINQKYQFVNWEILSEENVKIEEFNCDSTDWIWVLDPLDGTKDFIQSTGNYAMHLALNYKKVPLLGIVLIPEKDELWICDGEKVWGEKRDGTQIKTSLGNKKNLEKMVLVTSKNHRNQTLKNLIEEINFEGVIVMGSIGCKIASIIRGESDIYISLSLPGKSAPKDWDFAAPAVLLEAAGGAITNLDNEKLTYNRKNFEQGGIIIASNNEQNHKLICSEIKQIIIDSDLYPLKS